MAEIYKKTKQEFDQTVYEYLVKRLREPVEQTDAYGCGFIDERGAETQSAKANQNAAWAYTDLDKLIFFMKSAMGAEVNNLPKVFDWIDSLAIMNKADLVKNVPVYRKVIGLVEEISYLPPENRGAGQLQPNADDANLTMEQRLQRAFTCAQFLMYCIINNGTVQSENYMARSFDHDVLDATEATFNIRSVGTYREIVDFLKNGRVIDYAKVKPEGYALAVRIAKALVTADGTIFNSDTNNVLNEVKSWRTLSTYDG
jgi:hypothetical protein